MAKADFEVVKIPGGVRNYKVDERDTTTLTQALQPGEIVKRSTYYVTLVDSGDPEIATDEIVGVVSEASTETATADGTVDVVTLFPGQTVIRGKPVTSANIDTEAELLTYTNNQVDLDWTSGYTSNLRIDEDQTNDPNRLGIRIIAGDTDKLTLDVIVHINATEAGSMVGQTID
jgi:hypothetical protein